MTIIRYFKNIKHPIFLFAITFLLVSIFLSYWDSISGRFQKQTGYLYLDLANEINNIKKIQINTTLDSFFINYDEGQWRLPSLANYPISEAKIRKLLIGLAEIEKIEAKTANPKLYKELGVGLIEEGDENVTQIKLYDKSDKLIADLLVGIKGKVGGNKDTKYVRKYNSKQTWLIWDNFVLEKNKINWTEDSLVQIARWRIQNLIITNKDKNDIEIYRESYDQQNFKMKSIPDNYELTNPYIPNQLASALDRIKILDIILAKELDTSDPVFEAFFKTFDGLIVNIKAYTYNEKNWLKFSSLYAPEIRKELDDDSGKIIGLPEMPSLADVELEVDKINISTNEWAFEVSSTTYDQLNKKFSDLVNIKQKKQN